MAILKGEGLMQLSTGACSCPTCLSSEGRRAAVKPATPAPAGRFSDDDVPDAPDFAAHLREQETARRTPDETARDERAKDYFTPPDLGF